MKKYEKLLQAKELLLDVENELIEEKGKCPYELGFALRKLDEAIRYFQKQDL